MGLLSYCASGQVPRSTITPTRNVSSRSWGVGIPRNECLKPQIVPDFIYGKFSSVHVPVMKVNFEISHRKNR